jgi:hypothetical protein
MGQTHTGACYVHTKTGVGFSIIYNHTIGIAGASILHWRSCFTHYAADQSWFCELNKFV